MTAPAITDPTLFDADRAAAFEDEVVALLNHGALALMLSIGHRTGLFDTLAASGPVDADELARAAQLQPRYVHEWLGAMTTGRVVEHDPGTGTYRLPSEHARVLTRTGEANLAVYAQYLAVLGRVEDDVVACFREGGGVGYDAFPRFHEVMEEDSAQTVLPALRSHILPLAPELIGRLERGIRVLDVGCGRGRALVQLSEWFPNSTFVGYDLSTDAIAHARSTVARRGFGNVHFEVADAARLQERERRGAAGLVLTFDAVHDQADPEGLLQGIAHALADDGVYLAQDIDGSSSHQGDLDHPLGPLLYTISCLHCLTVSLAADGAGLGAMWGREQALELFARAGFGDVEVHTLDHDPSNAYYVCRR